MTGAPAARERQNARNFRAWHGVRSGREHRPSTTCAGLRRFRGRNPRRAIPPERLHPSDSGNPTSFAAGTKGCWSFSGCFYAGSPESDCVNISGTYTVAQDRRHVGRADPPGKGQRHPGPVLLACLRQAPHAPAASDCGKAGCMRAKSGPRLQFAGRGPFAGLPPGAKVHGMISAPRGAPGRAAGAPHAINGARRSAGGQHRTNGTGRQRPARRQAGNDRQARRRQCREASTR